MDEGSLGAHCANEYTNQQRDIGQPDWDDTRFGWFCMDVADTAETKKEAEELCSIDGVTCTYPAQQTVQAYVHHHIQFMKKMSLHAKTARKKAESEPPRF